MRRHSIPCRIACIVAAALVGSASNAQEPTNLHQRRVLVVRTDGGEPQELTAGPARRGFLGADLVDLTPELRAHYGVPEDRGVMISATEDDGPAARAGLAAGDILTTANGVPLRSALHLARLVAATDEGEAVALDCFRQGRRHSVEVPIEIRERLQFDISPLVRQKVSIKAPTILKIEAEPRVQGLDAEWIEELVRRVGESLTEPTFQEQLETMREERLELLRQLRAMEERLRTLEAELETLEDE